MGDIGRVTGKVRYEALFYWGPHRPREGRGDLEPFVGFHLSYRSPERLKVVRCPAGDKGLASFYPSPLPCTPKTHSPLTLLPFQVFLRVFLIASGTENPVLSEVLQNFASCTAGNIVSMIKTISS